MTLTKLVTLSALSGIFAATSYIPFPPWALFFCMVPLWIVWLDEKSGPRILVAGCITAIVSALIASNWVLIIIHGLDTSWTVATLSFVAFCISNNLFFPVTGVIWSVLSKRLRLTGTTKIWLLPILMDLGQRLTPKLFDWNFGYPWLWARLPGFQLADIIGFQGLSTATTLINGLLLWAWWLWRQKRPWIPSVAAAIVLFAALNAWGAWHAQGAGTSDAKLKFLVVQPNIDYAAAYAQRSREPQNIIVSQLAKVTWQGLDTFGRPDFVVWPENAFPVPITAENADFPYRHWLKTFVAGNWTPLITGASGWQESSKKVTNSFFVFGDDGELLAPRYDKTVLIAFGEYVPFADWLPLLRRLRPGGDLGRGTSPTVLDTGGVKIGPQICYEGLFDWLTRDLANQGAQILVNLGDDKVDRQEPYQHGFETLSRAIEVRRPLVRVTNSGLSMVMLARGELLTVSPLNETWSHAYEVPYAKNPPVTIFMTWGYWLCPAALVAAFALVLFAGQRRFRANVARLPQPQD